MHSYPEILVEKGMSIRLKVRWKNIAHDMDTVFPAKNCKPELFAHKKHTKNAAKSVSVCAFWYTSHLQNVPGDDGGL